MIDLGASRSGLNPISPCGHWRTSNGAIATPPPGKRFPVGEVARLYASVTVSYELVRERSLQLFHGVEVERSLGFRGCAHRSPWSGRPTHFRPAVSGRPVVLRVAAEQPHRRGDDVMLFGPECAEREFND
jgi:hypothetical protein